MRKLKYGRLGALAILAIVLFMGIQVSAHASRVNFQDSNLEDEYKILNGGIFIPIEPVAGLMGLSVLDDGGRLIIGGTVHGAAVVDIVSNTLTVNGQRSELVYRILYENGIWYAPKDFLFDVLGVQAVLDNENNTVNLYPLVTSIAASTGSLEIQSSAANTFTTFELLEPSRRVVDVKNVYLSGWYTQVTGAEIGLDSVREVRASQFSVDPPTVRIVLEWIDTSPPSHTILPEGRKLSVRIGRRSAGQDGLINENIIQQAVDRIDETENAVIIGTSEQSSGIQSAGTFSVDENEWHNSIFSMGLVDSANQLPAGGSEIIEQNPIEEILGPEISGNQHPAPPEPPELTDLPQGAAEMTLSELGWDVSLEMDSEGDVTAIIQSPAFQELNHFVLPGENPRLVIDITGTILPGAERSLDGLGAVEGIRFGQFEQDISRIVLDLERITGYTVVQSPLEGVIRVNFASGDLSGMVIVIDPGHGGEDPGAVQNGLQEKDLNLEMSFILRDILVSKGARVVMTRDTDVYVTLKDRVDIGRANAADLFISVHTNSSDEETTEQGIWLLYNNEEFMDLYRLVHWGVVARTGVPGRGPVEDDRGLYILRHFQEMPVLFIEAAFMTNPVDAFRLVNESRDYVRDIMEGVVDGILAKYAGYELPEIDVPGIEDGTYAVANYGAPAGTDVVYSSGATASWDLPLEIASGQVPTPDEITEVISDDGDGDESSSESDETDEEDEEESDEDEEDEEDEGSDNHRRRGRGGYRYR